MTPAQRATVLALATALAIPAEGLRRVYYYDPPGILSVCYGNTTNVDKTKVYSLTECRALLDKDMLRALDLVDRCAPGLPTPVLAAFGDAVYNIGSKIVCDKAKSTAARKLAAKDYAGACNELPRWSKANIGGVMITLPGLAKRRAAERDLCLQGVA